MKKIITIAAVFALCLTLGACSSAPAEDQDAPAGQSGSEQAGTIEYGVAEEKLEYARNDEVGQAYRVSVAAGATEDELKAVFEKVIADDGYDLHEVWFYSDERLTDGSAAYDVALVAKNSAEGEVVVTLATEEAKAAAQELLVEKDAGTQSAEGDGADAEANAEEATSDDAGEKEDAA